METLTLAPILLFVYNRPEHTQRGIESLQRNPLAQQSRLFIYSDAARTHEDEAAVAEVRRYIRTVTGFASVDVVERDRNWGLAASIVDGVTTRVHEFGRVIVLEDDLVVAPRFLDFMNDALDTYRDDERVGHVYACDFTGDPALPPTFFVKWIGSWGWGTWERAWRHFNPDGRDLLRRLEEQRLTRRFDFDGAYGFTRMLRRQIEGKNNSWAIRWNASLFLDDMLSLCAGRSLVQNQGFDGSGTHCGNVEIYTSHLWNERLPVERLPILENEDARACIARFYRRTNSFRAKALRRIGQEWKRLTERRSHG